VAGLSFALKLRITGRVKGRSVEIVDVKQYRSAFMVPSELSPTGSDSVSGVPKLASQFFKNGLWASSG
jgi:hypothetical protein